MYDQTLTPYLLPAPLIIKNFVLGEKDCNYEKYLLEFINESKYFLNKSNGELFVSPQKEDNGECDCVSSSYKIDFKLIASKTALQGRSILSMGKQKIYPGIISSIAPKAKNCSISTTLIYAALRDYDLNMLYELRKKEIKEQGDQNDILQLMCTLETNKNLLLFFPYNFKFKTQYEFDKGVSQIKEAVENDFKAVMKYRFHVSPSYDTYFAFIYDEHIVFMKVDNGDFVIMDSVEISKSLTYLKLLEYCEF